MSLARIRMFEGDERIPMSFLREDGETITYRLWLRSDGQDLPFACTFTKGNSDYQTILRSVELDQQMIQQMETERAIDRMEVGVFHGWWW